MNDSPLTMADVEAAVASVIEPLRQQLAAVESRERLILNDLEATRAMKGRLLQTLRKLDPSITRPGPKKNGAATSSSPAATAKRRREATEAAIAAIDKVAATNEAGEVTKNSIRAQILETGTAMGQSRVSAVVDELHANGYLTLYRTGTGGHKIYRRTEDLNGESRPAN